jgi:uncharacterized protein YegL
MNDIENTIGLTAHHKKSNKNPSRPPKRLAEAHVALALVLDVSSSMTYEENGERIDALNNAVDKMITQMKHNERLKDIVDLAIFCFGNYNKPKSEVIYQGFSSVGECESVFLVAEDENTYVVDVLECALEFVRKRCEVYDKLGGSYKPWIVLMTDGELHDSPAEINAIGRKLKEREAKGRLHFLGLGVRGFKRSQLEKFTSKKDHIIEIGAADFGEFFEWVGRSMSAISTKAFNEDQLPVFKPK